MSKIALHAIVIQVFKRSVIQLVGFLLLCNLGFQKVGNSVCRFPMAVWPVSSMPFQISAYDRRVSSKGKMHLSCGWNECPDLVVIMFRCSDSVIFQLLYESGFVFGFLNISLSGVKFHSPFPSNKKVVEEYLNQKHIKLIDKSHAAFLSILTFVCPESFTFVKLMKNIWCFCGNKKMELLIKHGQIWKERCNHFISWNSSIVRFRKV